MPRTQNAGTLRATAEIQDRVSDPLRQIDRQIAGLAGGGASSLLRFASIGTGALASVGAAALAAGQEYTEALDIIATGTGATGAALEGLGDDLEGALGTSSTSAAELASALAALNTATGETGDGLTIATVAAGRFAQVFETDAGATAKTTGQILRQFNLDAADTEHVLDLATAASQRYGVGASAVLEQVRQFGPVLENAGFGLEQTVSLFGRLEASGIDVTRVMPGLNGAIRRLADEGVTDLDGAINSAIEQIRTLDTESEALDLATRTFGAEGAARLVAAIRDGAIPAVSELGTEFDGAAGSLVATQREVTTWADLASASWGRVVGAVGGLFDLSPPDWLTRLLIDGRLSDISIDVNLPDRDALDLGNLDDVRQGIRDTATEIGQADLKLAALQERLDALEGTRAFSSQAPVIRAQIQATEDARGALVDYQAALDRVADVASGAVGPVLEVAEANAAAATEYDKATAKLREQLTALPTVAERVRRLQVQHRLSARNAELDARAQRAFRDALEVVTLSARPAFVALDDTSEAAERLRRANVPLESSTLDLGDAYENLGPGVERATRLLRAAVSPSEALAQAEAEAAQRALEAAQATDDYATSLQSTGAAVSRFGAALSEVDPQVGRFVGGMGFAVESAGNLLQALATGSALGIFTGGLSLLTGAIGLFAGGARAADQALEEFNAEQERTTDLLSQVQSGALSAAEAFQQLADDADYAAYVEGVYAAFETNPLPRESYDALRQFERDLISLGVSAEDAAAEVAAIAADGIIDESERARIIEVAQSANDLADGMERARENADSAADAGLRLVANLDSRNPFDKWFADATDALHGLGIDIEDVLGGAVSAAGLSEAFQRSQLRPEDVTRAADTFGIGAGLEDGGQEDLLRSLGGADFSAIFDTAALTEYADALQTLSLSGVDAFEVLENASDEQRAALFATVEAAVQSGQTIPTALQPIIEARRDQLAAQQHLNAEQQRELDLLNSLPDDAYSDLTRDQQIFLTGVSAIIEALGKEVPEAITNLLNPAVESAADTSVEGAAQVVDAYTEADAERVTSAMDANEEIIRLDTERVDQAISEWERERDGADAVFQEIHGFIDSLPPERGFEFTVRVRTEVDGSEVSDAVLGAIADKLPDELRRRGYI